MSRSISPHLDAIGVHVHVEIDAHGHLSLPDDFVEASSAYFAADHRRPTIDEIAAYYRQRRTAAVVFTVDIEGATGHAALSHPEIADAAAEHPDVLIPFASIDPAKGRAGARTFRRLVEERGVRGLARSGVGPGDVVALLSHDQPRYAVAARCTRRRGHRHADEPGAHHR